VADVALSRATLEAQVASKPSVVAALKKYNRYVHFCKGQPYPAFPPSYTSVADFLLTLIRERGGSTRSIANDKSHIKQQCELHGFGWLSYTDDIKLRQVLAVAQGFDFSESKVKDALRFSMLVKIISKYDLTDPVQLLLATVLACGHNLLLRTGETVSHIRARQLVWLQSVGRRGVSLKIFRSKTYRTGAGFFVSADEFDHPFSAVTLLSKWWLLNDFAAKPESFLFPAIVRGCIVYSQPMSGAFLRQVIKSSVADIGLNPQRFSGHSLRAGGATDLFAACVPYWVIKKMGRWTSDAALKYYRSQEDVVFSVRDAFHRMSQSAL
jgi:hypothetical protein